MRKHLGLDVKLQETKENEEKLMNFRNHLFQKINRVLFIDASKQAGTLHCLD